MRAEILSIGTELLLGQIVDTNSAWLAGRLADLGVDCHWMSTVGDNLPRATEAIRTALARADLVVCTGGVGPTEDDLTREAIAAAVGEEPRVDAALEAELRTWFSGRGLAMPERNRKQAWLIPSGRALPNPNGTAPGWLVEKAGKVIVAMPGVPREMTPMWERHVEPVIRAGAAIRSRTLKLLGIGESAVEEALGDLVRSTRPTVATYAKNDGVHIRLADRDADPAARDARIGHVEEQVRARLGRYVWGADADTLAGTIGALLIDRGWRLATAESVTGGELARALSEGDPPWYAGGTVLPGADEAGLLSAVAGFGADVVALTLAEGSVVVVAGGRREPAAVPHRSSAELRRRATLAALDLIRRAIQTTTSPGSVSPTTRP
jgi:nicotinamide-nucleotide amidase